jgi:hypothetical protein
MQPKRKIPSLQLVVTQVRRLFPQPLSHSRTVANDDHVHKWTFLFPGVEICTGCGKMRKKPS